MYNVSWHLPDTQAYEKKHGMDIAVALCPEFDFKSAYANVFEEHQTLWVAAAASIPLIICAYFSKWFSHKWANYQKALAKRKREKKR